MLGCVWTRKWLTRLLIFFLAIFIIYSIVWFAILTSFSHLINKSYAGQYFDINSDQKGEKYFIKFAKVKPYGFPLKFALQVVNWSEENRVLKIEFDDPILIGYDLLKQHLFLSLSGEATARYKPLESGFGMKFKTPYSAFTIKLPLSLGLAKIITQGKDPFQIINLIKSVEFISKHTEIFDLVDAQKLYEEDYTRASCTFDRSKHYTDMQDFLNNIPSRVHILYNTKIQESNLIGQLIPAGLLLHRFAWPTACELDTDFYIQTNATNFEDIFTDSTVQVNFVKWITKTQEQLGKLFYKGKIDNIGNSDITIRTDWDIKLKDGYVDDVLHQLEKWSDQQSYLLKIFMKDDVHENFTKDIRFIMENRNKFNLTQLENRDYSLSLDTNLTGTPTSVTARINDFSLFSHNTGFRLTSDTTLNPLKTLSSTGLLACNNYTKIISILGNYWYNLKFKNSSDETKEVYIESLQNFLKTISDHPESNSADISIAYEVDFTNLNKIKIGTVKDLNNIIPLYYLALYKSAAKRIKPEDNVIIKMQTLIPDFDTKQKFLEKFVMPPFREIDAAYPQEVIN